jgi:hypothetical protein
MMIGSANVDEITAYFIDRYAVKSGTSCRRM